MPTAVYAGSFDPVTLGHLDIIRRSAEIFDHLIVAVADNPDKHAAFTVEERMEMLREITGDISHVEVLHATGLTVDFARAHGATCLVRGMRTAVDFEAERELAQINQAIAPEIETFFLAARPEHTHVSSSAVRQMAAFGCSLSGFVPDCLEARILRRLQHSK